jgi:ubiquinone/menaquinone biosynthesis C-methylase UbiE
MKKVSRRFVSALIDLGYMMMALGPAKRGTSGWYRHLIDTYYEKQSHRYDEEVIARDTERYGAALLAGLQQLRVLPSQILDLSTGTGFVALLLKKRFPDAHVIGTDLSEAMLRQARKKAEKESVNLEFVQADGAHLPFMSERFDLVAVQNAPLSVKEALRVLRPGGELVIAYTSGALVPRFWRRQLLAEIEQQIAVKPISEKYGDGFWILLRK